MPIAASVSAVAAKSASRNVTNRGCDSAASATPLHGLDVRHREVAIDRPDGVANLPGERQRIAVGLHHQRHAARRRTDVRGQLRVRDIHLGARLFDDRVVPHRADDADDGQPGLVVGAHHELPADRVFVGPVARRHRVVDDRDGHRVFTIGGASGSVREPA